MPHTSEKIFERCHPRALSATNPLEVRKRVRQWLLLRILERHEQLSTKQLWEFLHKLFPWMIRELTNKPTISSQISPDTITRDMKELEKLKIVKKIDFGREGYVYAFTPKFRENYEVFSLPKYYLKTGPVVIITLGINPNSDLVYSIFETTKRKILVFFTGIKEKRYSTPLFYADKPFLPADKISYQKWKHIYWKLILLTPPTSYSSLKEYENKATLDDEFLKRLVKYFKILEKMIKCDGILNVNSISDQEKKTLEELYFFHFVKPNYDENGELIEYVITQNGNNFHQLLKQMGEELQ